MTIRYEQIQAMVDWFEDNLDMSEACITATIDGEEVIVHFTLDIPSGESIECHHRVDLTTTSVEGEEMLRSVRNVFDSYIEVEPVKGEDWTKELIKGMKESRHA